MRCRHTLLALAILVLVALPAQALMPGTDLLVPAAGRGAPWGTDLFVNNPGDATVSITVYWLVRGAGNPNPISFAFSLAPGETAVLDDLILNDFGLASGNGAFRVVASGEVLVNSRIFATDGSGNTLGQGFAGIPLGAATAAGDTATIVGLSSNATFRTNIYATAGPDGAVMTLRLVDPAGNQLASTPLTLRAWEPYLRNITQALNPGVFDHGTLLVSVTSGAVVVGASKVDNGSTDPTTLESSSRGAVTSADGTYQFAIYDSFSFATGGNLVVEDGVVTAINGTYTNWDKLAGGESSCTTIFLWGLGLPSTPLAEFADGVVFQDSYQSTGSGRITWTVQLTVDDNMALTGTVDAVGSDFPSSPDDQTGCNGVFPALTLLGGKRN